MHTTVITPPVSAITLEQAKVFLRVEDNDQDEVIDALIAAAQGNIDGPDGWLGRCIGAQTLEFTADSFDFGVCLPYQPATDIVSVKYDDASNVEQTLDPTAYRLDRTGTLQCPFNGSWPSVSGERGSVRVTYRAGSDDVPAPIRQAMLLMIGHWYENRMAVSAGVSMDELPFGVSALLMPYRRGFI